MENREMERISAVQRFQKFDFDLNSNIHSILKLAADIYESPAAFITLIDKDDQWFKVRHGFEVLTMPRDTSFCTHTILRHEPFIVDDAQADVRFAENPFVKNPPNVRFYAGAALTTDDGYNIGTLCIMDARPKVVPEHKKQFLVILAKQAIHLMQLQLNYKLLNEKMEQIERQNNVLREIAFIQSHEFRGPLSTIMGLMNAIKDDNYEAPKEYLQMMEKSIEKLDEKIHMVVRSTEDAKDAYVIS